MGRTRRDGRVPVARVGLDVGRRTITMARLGDRARRPAVLAVGKAPTPPAALDGQGRLTNFAALVEPLTALVAQLGLVGCDAVLAVAAHAVRLAPVTLRPEPGRTLDHVVREAVAPWLDYPVEQALVTFEPRLAPATDDELHGFACAAPRGLVEGLVDAVEAAGLAALVIDAEPFVAVQCLLEHTPDPWLRSARVLLVDLGWGGANWVRASGREVEATGASWHGGEAVTGAVAAACGWDRATAESYKRERLDLHAWLPVEEDADHHRARLAADTVAESLAAVLLAEPAGETNRVEAILLYGGGARLRGFADRLAAHTGVPCRVGQPFGGLDGLSVSKLPESILRDQASFAGALGLALRPVTVEG